MVASLVHWIIGVFVPSKERPQGFLRRDAGLNQASVPGFLGTSSSQVSQRRRSWRQCTWVGGLCLEGRHQVVTPYFYDAIEEGSVGRLKLCQELLHRVEKLVDLLLCFILVISQANSRHL